MKHVDQSGPRVLSEHQVAPTDLTRHSTEPVNAVTGRFASDVTHRTGRDLSTGVDIGKHTRALPGTFVGTNLVLVHTLLVLRYRVTL